MQTISHAEHFKSYRPNLATVRSTLVGPVMILMFSTILAMSALYLFLFGNRSGSYFPAELSILMFSLVVCAGIAYAPFFRLQERRVLMNDIRTGRYSLKISPSEVVLITASGEFRYLYQDFDFVGKDSLFLGNSRDWGSLVLARKQPKKMSGKHRASIVRPVQKGIADPGTYDGITAIPLGFFSKDQFSEIVNFAKSSHANVHRAG